MPVMMLSILALMPSEKDPSVRADSIAEDRDVCVSVCNLDNSSSGSCVIALDGLHCRGGRAGQTSVLFEGVETCSPVALTPSILFPSLTAFPGRYHSSPSLPIRCDPALSGAFLADEVDYREGLLFETSGWFGDISENGDEPVWHPNIPSRENRTFIGDCTGGSLLADGIELPGYLSLLLAGETMTGGSDYRGGRELATWDNNRQDRAAMLGELSWEPSDDLELSLSADIHHRERGWSDWRWSRYTTPYIDSDTTSSTFGDTLAWGEDIRRALPTRFDDGSLISLELESGTGQLSGLTLEAALISSHCWNRIEEEGGGYLGDGFTTDDWTGYSPPARVTDPDGFYREGVSDALWYDLRCRTATTVLGMFSEVSSHHLDAGLALSYTQARETSVMWEDSTASCILQHWSAFPNTISGWISDEIFLADGTRISAGARIERFDPNIGETWAAGEPETKLAVEPAFRISHELGSSSEVRAAWRNSARVPSLLLLYYNTRTSTPVISEHTLIGNPDLELERSSDFEIGWRSLPTDWLVLDACVYYRDMSDLVSSVQYTDSLTGPWIGFENGGNAVSRGVEIVASASSGRVDASITYSLGKVTGNWSRPEETALYCWNGGDPGLVPDETCLDWDRRHSLEMGLGLDLPVERYGLTTFRISSSTTLRSGIPYMNTQHEGFFSYNLEGVGRNTDEHRYPWSRQTDLTVEQGLEIGWVELTVFSRIFNLFDERNIVWIADVDWFTAEADDDGAPRDPTGPYDNPFAYSAQRHFLFGLEAGF